MIRCARCLTRMRLGARVVAAIAGVLASFLLASCQAVPVGGEDEKAQPSLLRPAPLHFAPYQYVAFNGSLDKTRQETGVTHFFAAFVLSDGTCTPVWGGAKTNGLQGQRSAEIDSDFAKVRAAGGEVAVSFGGLYGAELATVCRDTDELTAAYQSVVGRYGLKRVDFDIEGAALEDAPANGRRAEAIANLQRAQPDLRVWVTLPVQGNGLTSRGTNVLKQLTNEQVILSGINIMTMNYNIRSADLGKQATRSAEAAFSQIKQLYPNAADADIWRTLTLTVMVGRNDTAPETLTLEDARRVREFASSRGVGTVSMWNAERDAPCPTGTDTLIANAACSGLDQQQHDFLRILNVPPPP